jgi:hypothetical protein
VVELAGFDGFVVPWFRRFCRFTSDQAHGLGMGIGMTETRREHLNALFHNEDVEKIS